MKKIIWSMLMATSITGALYAQDNGEAAVHKTSSGMDKVFGIDAAKVGRRFWIDLHKGNAMRLEVQFPEDIDQWENIDSILTVFLQDLVPFKDSLNDLLGTYRVDYVIDLKGRKKLRIQQYHEKGSSFLIQEVGSEPLALKIEQDTINIILTSPAGVYPKWDREPRNSRLTLYLNQYKELEGYVSAGLNGRIKTLRSNLNSKWVYNKGVYRLEKDSSVTATSPHGVAVSSLGNDYLGTAAAVGLGNYKNFFVPSFGLGVSLHFKRPTISHEIDIMWEPNFIFQPNAQGHLQTWRNDFLTVTYVQEKTSRVTLLNQLIRLSPSMSLSYLISRKGEYYDKNSFRLAMGGVSFFNGGLTIAPCLYFNNFFQQTTPAVRMELSF